MIKNSVVFRLQTLPKGHSDWLMSLQVLLEGKQSIVLISAYAPTLDPEPAEKKKFYSDLHRILSDVPTKDCVAVQCDFSARVGSDSESWNGALGKHGLRKCNDNGRLLLKLCTEHSLIITNTMFQLRNKHKTTWQHPWSKLWHLLDYILEQQRDRKEVLITKIMPSAECFTDHRLVRSKLLHKLQTRLKQTQRTTAEGAEHQPAESARCTKGLPTKPEICFERNYI